MGVGLTLFPFLEGIDPERGVIYTRDSLSFITGDLDIIEQFAKKRGPNVLKTQQLPQRLLISIPGQPPTRKDLYGEVLCVITAGELRRKLKLSKETFAQNRAIMAYVRKLPASTPIVLYFT